MNKCEKERETLAAEDAFGTSTPQNKGTDQERLKSRVWLQELNIIIAPADQQAIVDGRCLKPNVRDCHSGERICS